MNFLDPSEETKPVEVPDVEVGAFKAMLAFIYTDDLSGLNGDNAMAVLYAVPSGVLTLNQMMRVYVYPASLPELYPLQFPTNERGATDAFWCSVLAERPIPKKDSGVFYFEVKVLEIGEGDVYIGLATKQTLDGSDWEGRPYIRTRLRFGVDNDIIGCGVNLATRQIIFIKNGQRLDTDNLHADPAPL
uniref:BTB domain-containing protein n=1 Tax=Globodera pallida TaxID=36090 RepID=A0A183CFN4_GLOPA